MEDLLASLTFREAVKRPISYRFAGHGAPPEELAPCSYTVAARAQTVVTVVDGRVETRNKARPGDFVIAGPDRELYVLSPHRLVVLYDVLDTALVPRPQPRMVARVTAAALRRFGLPTDGAALVAPWGETMLVLPGDVVVREASGKHYRVARDLFRRTYTFVGAHPS